MCLFPSSVFHFRANPLRKSVDLHFDCAIGQMTPSSSPISFHNANEPKSPQQRISIATCSFQLGKAARELNSKSDSGLDEPAAERKGYRRPEVFGARRVRSLLILIQIYL